MIKQLELYKSLITMYDEETSYGVILDYLSKKGLTETDVEYFKSSYTNIEYTTENVKKYIDIIFYLGIPDMEWKFCNHIVYEYILKKGVFLNVLHTYQTIIDIIKQYIECDINISKLPFHKSLVFTNELIMYLSFYIDITSLSVINSDITNTTIRLLTNLTELTVENCPNITDSAISYQPLTKLRLQNCDGITDNELKKHIKLTHLYIEDCPNISNQSICKLKNLQSLHVTGYTGSITDHAVCDLRNIEDLHVCGKRAKITTTSIYNKRKLKRISMGGAVIGVM